MLGLSCIYEHDRQNSDYVVQCWGALRGRSEKAVELEQKRAVENFIYILVYRFVKEETLLESWLHVNRVTCCDRRDWRVGFDALARFEPSQREGAGSRMPQQHEAASTRMANLCR